MWLVPCLVPAILPNLAHAQSHIWSKGFGSTGSDVGNKVAVDGSGNVIVTGSFNGTVNFGGGGLVSAGGSDIFVAKFSPDGTHLWSKRFGSTFSENGFAVAVDGNGDVVVTGNFAGTVDFGGGGLVSAGATDIFLAKYSGVDGSHIWSKRFGSTGSDFGYAVAVDSSGNVVLTGFFSGTVDFGGGGLIGAGSFDVFVAKYSGTDGSHLWSKGYGSTGQDEGRAVAVDSAGNVVVTGGFTGTVNFGGSDMTSSGTLAIFVAKFSGTDGSHQWSKGFASANNDEGLGLAVDGSGNVVVTGFFAGTVDFGGGGLVTVNTNSDIFLIKFSGSDGSHLWSKRLGGPSSDQGNGVTVDGSGNVVLTGSILSTVNFGGGYRTGGGSQDIFVAKFSGSDGSHMWSDAFGSPSNDVGNAVAVDGSGNVLVIGSFNGTVNFGGSNLVSAGGFDIFVVKLGGNNDLSQLWSERAGGTSSDDGYAVAVDGSGNVVVTGLFQGTVNFGGTNLVSVGGYDIFLAKFSGVDGSHLWSKRFGGNSDDAGRAVAFDSNGNVLLTGAFRNTANFGGSDLISASVGIGDIFVAKFDSNGNHLWSTRYGSTGVDAGRAIAADGSGNVVVAGFFSGTVDFGGGNRISAGGEDIFLAKFSGVDGSHLWSQRFGSTLDDEGASIAVDGSGDVVVTGFFQGTVNFGGGNRTGGGSQEIFLAKYSGADGSHLWSKAFGGTGQDQSFGVALDGSGNVAVTGVFQNTVDFGGGGGGLTSAGSFDIFLAKYLGSDGSHVWSKRFGSTGDDEGRAVAVDGSGNVVVTGTFNNTVDFGGGGLTAPGLGFGDVYVAEFSGADGSHLWSKRFGSTGQDGGLGIAVDGSGNAMVTGGFQLTVDFGSGYLASAGGDDIFLLKLAGTPVSPVHSKRRSQITSQ